MAILEWVALLAGGHSIQLGLETQALGVFPKDSVPNPYASQAG